MNLILEEVSVRYDSTTNVEMVGLATDGSQEFLKMGGLFTLSDDSHGIAQVGTNFQRALDYLYSLRVENLHFFESKGGAEVKGAKLETASAPLAAVRSGEFRYSQRTLL
jgi:hypothetical protein